jgi:hypothetical protein
MRSLIKGPWLQGRDYHGRREDADGGGERRSDEREPHRDKATARDELSRSSKKDIYQ